VILFTARSGVGLFRVSSAGGVPSFATTLDPATGEDGHRWPHFLPDGRHFFYTAITGACCPAVKPATIRIASLDPAEAAVTLFQAESSVSYASGHLFFARDETLMAQPFDPDARKTTGDAFPLAEYVGPEGSRYVSVSVSENGTLVYGRDGSLAPQHLTWFDRAGRALATLGDAGRYINLALSPDEGRVAVALRTGGPENVDIWITDIARNVRSRLTADPGPERSPVWSPDGTRIAFEGLRSDKFSMRQKLIDGTAADELLLEGSSTPSRPCEDVGQCYVTPSAWSADGRFIAYTVGGSFPQTADIWVLPLFGERKPFPVAQTEFLEGSGVFSPDGRWIAYTSTEAGQNNVYVQPFPGPGGKYRVSPDGGSHPLWRADGKELFYLRADATMIAVSIDATGPFGTGVPQALFPTSAPTSNFFRHVYSVTKDGQRFLVNARPQQPGVAPLTVVVNWMAAIQK
jgi:hypothetical protein